jgi:hypothetical protein
MRAGNRMDPEGFSNAFKWVRTGNHGWILSLKIVIPSADFQGLLSPFAQWPRISANQSWRLAPHRSDLMGDTDIMYTVIKAARPRLDLTWYLQPVE